MSKVNFDIVLYNTPSFENLISEFYRISRYKRNIYKKIRNEDEYFNKLSSDERVILKHLSEQEDRILLDILCYKSWLNIPFESLTELKRKLGDEASKDSNSGFDQAKIDSNTIALKH